MGRKWQTRQPSHKGKSIRAVCGPLRKIVDRKPATIERYGRTVEIEGLTVEVLECGHEQNQKSDFIGYTNAEKRRCKKCGRQEREGNPPA